MKQAYEEELAIFKPDAERAKKLLAAGDSPRNEQIDPAEHAALSIVMSIILNLDRNQQRFGGDSAVRARRDVGLGTGCLALTFQVNLFCLPQSGNACH